MKKNEQTLGEAIRGMLKAYGLEERMSEMDAIQSWEKLMGPVIAKYTKDLRIKNDILYIRLASASLKEELHYSREKIIKGLNKEAGREVVKEIRFI